ncbi:MAG: DUF5317 family protein, partial [Chloroflexi bacterium]|nr:DUF5317 family protein [Chloroflexota bacterium]
MTLYALALFVVALGIAGWRMWTLAGRAAFAPPAFRLMPLGILALALQFVALRWAGGVERIVVFTLSYISLFLFFVANFQSRPLRLLGLGFLLNLLPILFNGGYMPITPEAMASLHPSTTADQWGSGLIRPGSKDIVLTASEARLGFLGDIFIVSPPFPLPTAFSLGDILIFFGFTWSILWIPHSARNQK